MQAANAADYIRAILTDYGELLEPMAQLKEKYPNTLTLEREHQLLSEPMENYEKIDLQRQTPEQLFGNFYRQITGSDITEDELSVLTAAFQALREVE